MSYTHIARYRGLLIDFHYDENGEKHITYHHDDLNLQLGLITQKESKYKSLKGQNIEPYFFNTCSDYFNFIKEHEETLAIYGNIGPEYQYIHENYLHSKYDLKNIKTFCLDIEVKSDKGFPDPETTPQPITSIAIKDKKNDRYYVCSLKPYDKYKTILKHNPKRLSFYHAPNEERLFMWFIKLMQKELPDILVGWYSENFDFPYIINRSYVVFGGEDKIKDISPYGDVRCESSDNGEFGRRIFRTVVGGVYTLDYMRLYKKFLQYEVRDSYSLDYISEVELSEHKLKFEETNLNELWMNNSNLYIDYNIFDTELISLIDDKLKLLDLLMTIAYKARCNFHDALGTVRMWDVFIYHYLKQKNIMIPPNVKKEKHKFAGAYVKEPICDIHKWVVSLDLNSLYPHLQQQFNISPECLVEDIKEDVSIDEIDEKILNQKIEVNKNHILAGNGYYFRKDIEGFIPKMLREIYAERKDVKKKMLQRKQELVELENQLKEIEKNE